MQYIKGKYKSSIFSADSGYMVGLFRVKEASEDLSDIVNKTITFTGYFPELNTEDVYNFYGTYTNHERYGYQFQVQEYEKVEPEGKDAVVEFLSSSFVKGCGEKTAQKIVNVLGDNAIELIKKDKANLYKVGLSEKTTNTIYKSIMSYYDQDETIIYLKGLNLSVKEITTLLTLYGTKVKTIIENDLYSLVDYIEFKKLDIIYFMLNETTNKMRKLALIIQVMKELCFETGNVYLYKDQIINRVMSEFQIDISEEADELIKELGFHASVKKQENKYYLMDYYLDEKYIANALFNIYIHETNINNNFDKHISGIEKAYHLEYNEEQKKAISEVLSNSVTIITGGPGTGKTTIINGIIRMYQEINHISDLSISKHVALLAPTGRASKRMAETTNLPASTIHRYLKWNQEDKTFGVNEYNPNNHKLIIVDETSMIDNNLMASLLKGVNKDIKIVFVGDEHQLPSVGPGNILQDLIQCEMFPHVRLKNIYRQSEDSFIPVLAQEIRNYEIESDVLRKRDDYNFIECNKIQVKEMLAKMINICIERGLSDKDIQVLVPMYKGENGIDNINVLLQNLLNPKDKKLDEVTIGPYTYRVNDKVICLVNNADANVFNGDIGYIKSINTKKSSEFMTIDFYGNLVSIKRDEIGMIKHAYCMSIHKSQGSEFNHVIMPITKEYSRMLYNRLLYTGISRAKKSLVIIGDKDAFMMAVTNNYSQERMTSLKEMITDLF